MTQTKLKKIQKQVEKERGPAPASPSDYNIKVLAARHKLQQLLQNKSIAVEVALGDELAEKIITILGIPKQGIMKVELAMPASQAATVTITRFLTPEEAAAILGESK